MLDFPSLPSAPEIEEAILAAVFAQQDKTEVLAEIFGSLSVDDFYGELNCEVFKACQALYNDKRAISEAFVTHQLRQNLPHIPITEDFVSGYRWKHSGSPMAEAIHTVKTLASNRQLITQFYELLEQPDVLNGPLVQETQKLLVTASQNIVERTEARLDAILPTVAMGLEERIENKTPLVGLPTGFRSLDSMIGGLQPTRLITLCAITAGEKQP